MNGASGLPNLQCGSSSLSLVAKQNLAGSVLSPKTADREGRTSSTADRTANRKNHPIPPATHRSQTAVRCGLQGSSLNHLTSKGCDVPNDELFSNSRTRVVSMLTFTAHTLISCKNHYSVVVHIGDLENFSRISLAMLHSAKVIKSLSLMRLLGTLSFDTNSVRTCYPFAVSRSLTWRIYYGTERMFSWPN